MDTKKSSSVAVNCVENKIKNIYNTCDHSAD